MVEPAASRGGPALAHVHAARPASAMAWVLFAVILAFSVLQFRLLRGHTEY